MVKERYGGRWNYVITGRTATSFRNNVDKGSTARARKATIKLVEEIKTIYKGEKTTTARLNRLIKKLTEAPNKADVLNPLLTKVYDFCDEYGIFIDLW